MFAVKQMLVLDSWHFILVYLELFIVTEKCPRNPFWDLLFESKSPSPRRHYFIHTLLFPANFTGNGAVHEHAEPQPWASRRFWAHDQALLWLQRLQQGKQQQQGHQASSQEEVVPYLPAQLPRKKLDLCRESKIFKCNFLFALWVFCTDFFSNRSFEHILISNILLETEQNLFFIILHW